MLTTSFISIAIFLASFTTASIWAERRQQLVLYMNNDYTGLNQSYYDNVPDLQNTTMGAIAKSVCVYSGVWVISGVINGETTFDGWNSANIGVLCSTWNVGSQTAVYLSIRRVAGSYLDRPSISLYSEPSFRGTEVHVDGDQDFRLENASLSVASIAFTGRRDWALFSHSQFLGEPACMEAQALGTFPMDVSFYTPQRLHVGSLQPDCPRRGSLFPALALQPQLGQTGESSSETSFQLPILVDSQLVGSNRVAAIGSAPLKRPIQSVRFASAHSEPSSVLI